MTDQSAPTTGESRIPRFAVLDSVRGLAALAVACFHFHGLVTFEHTRALFGPVLDWVCERGDLGVEVFFVLSGFVLTHVLRPLRLRASTFGRFMLRRSVRLDPTYWVVLFVTIVVNSYLTQRGIMHRPPATVGLVLANMFYLQDLLAVHSPVNAAWTLCIEMQFYLFFVLSLWAFQLLRERLPVRFARLIVFGPPVIAAFLMASGRLPTVPGLFLQRWHFFFLGTLVYWCLNGILSTVWFWCYIVFMLVICDAHILGGLGCGLAIWGMARLGLLDAKKRGLFLPWLGSRSYSMYLVHVLVGSNLIRVLLRMEWLPNTNMVLLGYFALALLASFVAAEILYRLVERPTHQLGRRIAWESPSIARQASETAAAPAMPAAPQFTLPPVGPVVTAWDRLYPGVTSMLRNEHGWLVYTGVFAAIWLLELYVIQGLTLDPRYHGGDNFDFYAPKIRFAMDVCFVGTCMSVLGRKGLIVAAVCGSVLNLILLTYYDYFYYPMSLLHVFQNRKEGMELSGFAWDLLDSATLISLAAVLVLKLFVLRSTPPAPRLRTPAWMGFFGAFAVGYVVLFIVADYKDPLETIAYKRTLGRLGIIRGYLGPWIAEFYYLNDDRLMERAMKRRDYKSDQLTELEIPLKIEPRLVIIQAESLDQNVIGYRIGGPKGQEVTPFLNRLRDEAMYFRIKVFHYQGSCDSDFTMLEGVAATPRVNAYSMHDYPFTDSLPRILQDHGYEAIALHGFRSDFYNRGEAFKKMGFDHLLFQELLEQRFGLPVTNFGITDQEVLRFSSHLLRESKGPTSQFIITLTSHAPYEFVTPGPDYPFPNPANIAERYFNHMRYLDDCLRDYIASLPKQTTVVIYGDHCAGAAVATEDFKPDRADGMEFAPCFIYDTDRNLAKEQRTLNEPVALDGTLNLLDVSTYLRGRIKAGQAVTQSDKRPEDSSLKPPPAKSTEPPPDAKTEAQLPATSAEGEPIARRPGASIPLAVPADP